ncbi:MAG: DUF1016 family protein [Sedimentisphaerales bacterium]|nr:DUF1016 family protein [Sedimentisphaerales bacterium]
MNNNTHSNLIGQVKEIISQARSLAVRSVNTLQVASNFLIGQQIVIYEQEGCNRAEYGSEMLNQLSVQLTSEFGKGYSLTNLKLFRQFFISYRDSIGQTLSDQLPESIEMKSQNNSDIIATSNNILPGNELHLLRAMAAKFSLSWSHYVFLMAIKDDNVRSFYEIEAAKGNWSLRELKRLFNSALYERLALSRDKDGIMDLAQKGQVIDEPKDVIKNPYVLEFLGLDEKAKYSENELETAIINKVEHFLLELGKGFLFESRQKRFTFDEDHYFVDLVFYNRLLRCYTLIDLKIGELTHQDLGQMQMYVNYFDRHVKQESENPTIGIILCRKNKKSLVEITLPQDANIHASEYLLYLPSKEQLQKQLEEAQDEWESSQQK